MNRTRWLTYVVTVLLLVSGTWTSAQDMNNTSCGRVNNLGTISIKGSLTSVRGARIENKSGVLLCGGNTEIRQAEILGYVEYLEDSLITQQVPQIRHSSVTFSGRSPKILDTTYNGNNFVSVDTMLSKAEAELRIHPRYPLIALGRVTHEGHVNTSGPNASVILQGSSAQTLDGQGVFRTLELDNASGVFMVNKAEIGVQDSLYLHHGTMHNSVANNLMMLDSSFIVRSDESMIDERVAKQRMYSVKYVGRSAIASARELPSDSKVLRHLVVENDGGLDLTENIHVNDSLIVGRVDAPIAIRTDADSNRHTLTMTSATVDPVYVSSRSEVVGSMQRSALRVGSTPMVFNNRFTRVQFARAEDLANASSLILDSRPHTFPMQARGEQKIQRKLDLIAFNANNQVIQSGLKFKFHYAWIDDLTSTSTNESNNLDVARVILQRWDSKKWANIKTSITPAQSSVDHWMVSSADSVTTTGSFAIGMPTPIPPMLVARVQLEGAYRDGSMATDLVQRNLVPSTPPNIYPYSLDPARDQDTMKIMPPDAVDWVVVELRRGISIRPEVVKTGLLLRDGKIMNPDGLGYMTFADTLTARDYYVVLRHRSHLSIMTSQPWHLVDEDDQTFSSLDLSDGLKVFGGFGALKPVCFGNGQPMVFAMPAGDVNSDGIIDDRDRSDYDQIYALRDSEGYKNEDVDMNGIVTTRDINKSWNNRLRRTNVPR